MYLAAKVASSEERSDSQGTSSRSQVHGRNGGEDQVCGGIRCRLNNNGRFTDGGVDLRGEGGRKWEPRSGGGDGAEVRLMESANLGDWAVGVHVACEGEEGAREVVCGWVGMPEEGASRRQLQTDPRLRERERGSG